MSNEAIKLSQLGDQYLNRFFQLGLSSVSPTEVSTNHTAAAPQRLWRYCLVIPSVRFLIVVVVVSVLSFKNFSLLKINFENTVYCVFVACAFATCAMTLQRTLLFNNQSHCLWLAITDYEHFVWQRLQIKMTFGAFRRRYGWSVWISMCLFFVQSLVRIAYRMHHTNFVRQLAALMLIFGTLLINFQILFYVSLFASLIGFLNLHISAYACDAIECETSDERSKKLTATFKSYKLVYYKLYEISQLLSENFGCVTVALIMQNVIITVQPMFWIIVELHEDHISANILRITSTVHKFN